MKPKTADQHNRDAGVQPTTFTPAEKKPAGKGKISFPAPPQQPDPSDGWQVLAQPIPIQDFNDRRGRMILLDDNRIYLIGDLSFAALSTMRVKVVAYTDSLVLGFDLIEKRFRRYQKGV